MTNFFIFFIIVFILSLLILWMMLDYQFTRYIRTIKVAQLGNMDPSSVLTDEIRINQNSESTSRGTKMWLYPALIGLIIGVMISGSLFLYVFG
ncbi:hypothetical protein A7907_06285 [Acinetobacter baumannii]|nr:hypothetical protein B7L41_18045 [Acinetobacter baumannii]AVN15745.1 hypothetical protein C6N18_17140 [Acinetobacter baumannii]AXB15972.1 hypothetical protein DPV67_11225 [Acinetobacter baumannii]KAB1105286.1 hypothetical protein F6W75_10570 [Acinetobacter baumannii]MVT94247.1 hypothetical protein [Acinetobacter baumannii]